MRVILLILFLLVDQAIGQEYNCSAFVTNKGNVFLAKNFDWDLGDGIIVFNPGNKIKRSIYSKESSYTWTSRYSSITFNHLGVNQPLGGMNETGFTVEELSTWPVEYPDGNNAVSEFEWIQYQLDNFSTVNECVANIEETAISKFCFNLHFIIADSTGNSAAVEFVNGKANVYKGNSFPVPALTNNNYPELLRYLSLIPASHYKELDISGSQDRFLKIMLLLKEEYNSGEIVRYSDAMNLLDSVSVRDTKWSIVYDIRKRKIYYKTGAYNRLKSLSFSKLKKISEYKYIDINSAGGNNFEKFGKSKNEEYLNKLIKNIEKLPGSFGKDLVDKINTYLK